MTPTQEIIKSKAVCDVLNERERQIKSEGWSAEHDDNHTDGELAQAAGCYALFGDPSGPYRHYVPAEWPWDRSWWKVTDYRRSLVKAAALLLAEIERVDRANMGGDVPLTREEG